MTSVAGPATYRKQFTVSAAPAGKRLFLEMADVHEYAKVKLNGKELEAHAWQPFRWEVTNGVKPGANDLEVEVRTSGGGRGGFEAPPPPPAGAGAAAAGGRGGRGAPGAAVAGAPPAAAGGGRGRGNATPAVSGLLGPVRLVAR